MPEGYGLPTMGGAGQPQPPQAAPPMDAQTLTQLLESMSPEDLAALLGASNVPNRNALLAQELEAAQGFGGKRSGPALTPLGGALGGASDAVRDVTSAYKTKQLLGKMDANLGKLENPDVARLAFGAQPFGAQSPQPGGMDEETMRRVYLSQLLGGR